MSSKKQNQRKIDVLELITRFRKSVLERRYPFDEVLKEVQLMGYKIKPLMGNVSTLNFKNKRFIETLWYLGKTEEFFHRTFPKLNKEDKKVFIKILDEIRKDLERKLNKIELKPKISINKDFIVEMQIYRNISSDKKTVN